MTGVIKEMGVGVEGDRDSGVAEDATDLGDVEPEVDDQVAGEGLAQVVEAQRRPAIVIQLSRIGGAGEYALGDVAVAVRGTVASSEDPVDWSGEGRCLLVGSKLARELLDQRHLAYRGRCLRRHPPRRFATVRA